MWALARLPVELVSRSMTTTMMMDGTLMMIFQTSQPSSHSSYLQAIDVLFVPKKVKCSSTLTTVFLGSHVTVVRWKSWIPKGTLSAAVLGLIWWVAHFVRILGSSPGAPWRFRSVVAERQNNLLSQHAYPSKSLNRPQLSPSQEVVLKWAGC